MKDDLNYIDEVMKKSLDGTTVGTTAEGWENLSNRMMRSGISRQAHNFFQFGLKTFNIYYTAIALIVTSAIVVTQYPEEKQVVEKDTPSSRTVQSPETDKYLIPADTAISGEEKSAPSGIKMEHTGNETNTIKVVTPASSVKKEIIPFRNKNAEPEKNKEIQTMIPPVTDQKSEKTPMKDSVIPVRKVVTVYDTVKIKKKIIIQDTVHTKAHEKKKRK